MFVGMFEEKTYESFNILIGKLGRTTGIFLALLSNSQLSGLTFLVSEI